MIWKYATIISVLRLPWASFEEEENVCSITFEPIKELKKQGKCTTLSCGHAFETEALDEWLKDREKKCPYCQQEIKRSQISAIDIFKKIMVLTNCCKETVKCITEKIACFCKSNLYAIIGGTSSVLIIPSRMFIHGIGEIPLEVQIITDIAIRISAAVMVRYSVVKIINWYRQIQNGTVSTLDLDKEEKEMQEYFKIVPGCFDEATKKIQQIIDNYPIRFYFWPPEEVKQNEQDDCIEKINRALSVFIHNQGFIEKLKLGILNEGQDFEASQFFSDEERKKSDPFPALRELLEDNYLPFYREKALSAKARYVD
jgi:hypothetical protein